MTWTAISWAFGEQPSAAKRNLEFGSTEHVREEASYYPVLTAEVRTVQSAETSGTTYAATLVASVNSGAISLGGATSSASGTRGITADVDISALAAGLHTLNLTLQGTHDTTSTSEFEFYKSVDMDYLTCIYTVYEDQNTSTNIYTGSASVTVIGHREPKTWT